ncbi:hypothetical protein PAXRUDRAFT_31902 [Paxillus rubicundulus Ve08.2h10]|uniref:NADP-dependent oxidoreductase domain-containing protein n=1 Tax=Paxillus rubicundulus Ve08.2h10 TaxID=930991 RepID=A0A0D0DTJ3_9AGAM|nr:hypothetical protein PAXRUDRAFT_31902 [Paxillus rubicundulus Ve08.2h10]
MTAAAITLDNGVQIAGTGTGVGSQACPCVPTVLQAGYRHIDTAAMYGKDSSAIRLPWEIIRKSGIPRGDIFVAPELPRRCSWKLDETGSFNDTSWKEMEKLSKTGKVEVIGVSNFSIKTYDIICPSDMNALANMYNATPTQIIHSWRRQRGAAVITNSENVNRQKDDLKTITASPEAMQRINTLDSGKRVCVKPDKNGKTLGWGHEWLGWVAAR